MNVEQVKVKYEVQLKKFQEHNDLNGGEGVGV